MKNVSRILVLFSVLLVLCTSCRKRVYCSQCSFSNAQDSIIYEPKECFDRKEDAEAYIQQLKDSYAAQGYQAECMIVIPK